jgi:polyisoprenoid-binding protein YceI
MAAARPEYVDRRRFVPVNYAMNPPPAQEGTSVQYRIDGNKSTLTVRAFATGLLSSLGHDPVISAPGLEGEILFDPAAIEQSSLRLVVQASSLTVTNDISSKDRAEIDRRMQEEVLESDSFPEVVYQTTKISASKTGEGQYWANLNGELTLHGLTSPQSVSARFSITGDRLRATGEFTVRQSDYRIRPVTAVGGAIKLKDELKFAFDIVASKQA